MLRLIRADLYRLFHLKGFYLILLAIIGLASIVVSSESFTTMVATVEFSEAREIVEGAKWNPSVAIKAAYSSSSLLIYFFLAFFVWISGHEITQNTYKNTIASGARRFSFVLSKYFTQLVMVTVGMALYLGTVFLLSSIKYGWAKIMVLDVIKDIIGATFSLAFCVSVVLSLATVLLFAFSSNVLAAVFIAVFPWVIQLTGLTTQWNFLKHVDFFSMGQNMALKELSGGELVPYLMVNFLLISCSVIICGVLLKKKEL